MPEPKKANNYKAPANWETFYTSMQKCRHVLLTEVYRDIPYLFFVAEATTEAVVFEGDEKRVLPLTPAAIKKITLIRHPENSTYGGFSFLLRNEEYTVYPLSLTPVFQL